MSLSLTRDQQVRQAVLLTFCEPVPALSLQMLQLSSKEWQELLRWLDTSGLALYFLDRMEELQLWHTLPHAVFARLKQNLLDNSERTRSLIAESTAIQREFQQTGLSYALLKGFSLWPHSVPRLELRTQLDLDFLIAEKDIHAARQILEHHGYHLHAISGRSWEFKTGHIPRGSLDDLYKYVPHRCVELHSETSVPGQRSLLANAISQEFHGIRMPVLSPVDHFIGQGTHLFKHVCSESSRASHFLEYRRHVLARHDDAEFWDEVRSIAELNRETPLALGVITLLLTRLMGDFAPESLSGWTVSRVPFAARLWIELYGHNAAFADFRGTKFYLLLQRELESAGLPAKRTVRRALIPLRLPPLAFQPSADESLRIRISRSRLQLKFILFRLRFHVFEGIRYSWHSFRWRRTLSRFAQAGASSTAADAPLLTVPASLAPTTKE